MKKQNDLAKRKLKILIVDDLEFPRMVIRNMFHDLGYESHNNILEAANGLEALGGSGVRLDFRGSGVRLDFRTFFS